MFPKIAAARGLKIVIHSPIRRPGIMDAEMDRLPHDKLETDAGQGRESIRAKLVEGSVGKTALLLTDSAEGQNSQRHVQPLVVRRTRRACKRQGKLSSP